MQIADSENITIIILYKAQYYVYINVLYQLNKDLKRNLCDIQLCIIDDFQEEKVILIIFDLVITDQAEFIWESNWLNVTMIHAKDELILVIDVTVNETIQKNQTKWFNKTIVSYKCWKFVIKYTSMKCKYLSDSMIWATDNILKDYKDNTDSVNVNSINTDLINAHLSSVISSNTIWVNESVWKEKNKQEFKKVKTSEDWKKTSTLQTLLLFKSLVLWVKVVTLLLSFINISITLIKTTHLLSWSSATDNLSTKEWKQTEKRQNNESNW